MSKRHLEVKSKEIFDNPDYLYSVVIHNLKLTNDLFIKHNIEKIPIDYVACYLVNSVNPFVDNLGLHCYDLDNCKSELLQEFELPEIVNCPTDIQMLGFFAKLFSNYDMLLLEGKLLNNVMVLYFLKPGSSSTRYIKNYGKKMFANIEK